MTVFIRTGPAAVAIALWLAALPALAQDATVIERRDRVNNIVVIDDKLVVRERLPGARSGISLGTEAVEPETRAREDAVENRIEEDVRPAQGRPVLVRGKMDNLVQAEGVFAIKRSEKAKACIQIGTVGAEDECAEKD